MISFFSRELLVLLDATDPVEVELYVSYVVSKAKWSPKYDIRVFSSDNSMKVITNTLNDTFLICWIAHGSHTNRKTCKMGEHFS